MAQIFYVCADILDRRECLVGANISWARIFHGREYFMGANISWARIFHGRENFMGANILMCANILRVSKYFKMCAYIFDWKRIFYVQIMILGKRQYLMIFAVSSTQFYFSQ